jgi:AcrR family transcriptional regulator
MKVRRAYRMTVRADAAADTARRILDAATELFSTMDYEALTLQAVAERAGVTLQTVLRRFGSKDGLITAAAETEVPAIRRSRKIRVPGDVVAAVRTLVRSYEKMGDLNWRLLRQEQRFPTLHRVLLQARALHREWIEESFSPQLARAKDREQCLTLLFVATDFYQWKLLRVDLGHSRAEVERLMVAAVRAAVGEGQ